MAGGVVNLTVEDCVFRHTDRGLRIKTRRAEEKMQFQQYHFPKSDADHVMTPLVVNCFYFCDPDGKTQLMSSPEMFTLWMTEHRR